jgi:hypothetical protein
MAKNFDKNINTLYKWAKVFGARSERTTTTNTNILANIFNKNDELTAKFEKAFKNVKKCRETVTDFYFLA